VNQTTSPAEGAADYAAVRGRNLRTVGALGAVFLLPLLISFWMYYGGAWRPAGRSNHGELIAPARALPTTTLPTLDGAASVSVPIPGKWQLVYAAAGACDAACERALVVMRQTRLALNNEMTRVERVLLATGGCCDRELLSKDHAGIVALDASAPAGGAFLAAFPRDRQPHSIYVVDPLGNLMMRHDASANPKGLLSDLKKLLKLSHIG
jgi:hypothetical protein